jgi:hypothetical protein
VNNSEKINGAYSTYGKSENTIVVMEDIKRTDQLGDLYVYEMIILKCILKIKSEDVGLA